MLRDSPQGTQLYEITPFGELGNYFTGTNRHSYRQQWIANLFLPNTAPAGDAPVEVRIDFERERFTARRSATTTSLARRRSVARLVSFEGRNRLAIHCCRYECRLVPVK